jgi:hypothetical protein
MGMFDEPGDPCPLTEATALLRADKCVEPIARFFMYMSALLLLPAILISELPPWVFAAIAVAIWYIAWVVLFRRWRAWAISGGCDADYLEWLGEKSGVLAARGSWLWYLQWPAHAP